MTVNGGARTYAEDLNGHINAPHGMASISHNFTNGAIEQIEFSAVQWNTRGVYVSGNQFVVPTGYSGLWECGIIARFASQATAAGQRNIRIYKNGSEEMSYTVPAVSNLNATNIPVLGVYEQVISAGDVITFWGFQNSGGALALVGNSRVWMRVLQL